MAQIDGYALRAVSLAFPMQSLMIAFAAGTSVGIISHIGEERETVAVKR